MAVKDPVAELEPRFSSDDATLTPWEEARGLCWLLGSSVLEIGSLKGCG